MEEDTSTKIGASRKFVRVNRGKPIDLYRLKAMEVMLRLEMDGVYKSKRISVAQIIRAHFKLHPRATRRKCMKVLLLAIWRAERA